MESNAVVTEALGDFITRVKTEKCVCVPFYMSLHTKYLQMWGGEPQFPQGNLPVPSSGIDRLLYSLWSSRHIIVPCKAEQGQLA